METGGSGVTATGGTFPDYFKSELMETLLTSLLALVGLELSRLLQIGINGNGWNELEAHRIG